MKALFNDDNCFQYIVLPPMEIEIMEIGSPLLNSALSLICIVSITEGVTPQPSVVISKDSETLETSSVLMDTLINTTLILNELAFEDAGLYTCAASFMNPLTFDSDSVSKEYNVTIKSKSEVSSSYCTNKNS